MKQQHSGLAGAGSGAHCHQMWSALSLFWKGEVAATGGEEGWISVEQERSEKGGGGLIPSQLRDCSKSVGGNGERGRAKKREAGLPFVYSEPGKSFLVEESLLKGFPWQSRKELPGQAL